MTEPHRGAGTCRESRCPRRRAASKRIRSNSVSHTTGYEVVITVKNASADQSLTCGSFWCSRRCWQTPRPLWRSWPRPLESAANFSNPAPPRYCPCWPDRRLQITSVKEMWQLWHPVTAGRKQRLFVSYYSLPNFHPVGLLKVLLFFSFFFLLLFFFLLFFLLFLFCSKFCNNIVSKLGNQ